MADNILTQDYLKTIFDYKDGVLYWKIKKGSVKAGKIAGSNHTCGYFKIALHKKTYLLHRIIFMMHYGYMPEFIDHINNNKKDNRIENLRFCSKDENLRNRKISKNNTSGIKNISWSKNKKRWCVYIGIGKGNNKYIGSYKDLELAKIAAFNARIKYHGDYVNHG